MGISERKFSLSANAIKLIAVIAMLIDHIGWAFVDISTPLGQLMHFIGRFTAPLMCFFIAEGYYYTKDLEKYKKRLLIFALISHFPFLINGTLTKPPLYYAEGKLTVNDELFVPLTGVIFTLFLGLWALEFLKSNRKTAVKALGLMVIFLLSLMGDWIFFAVLWIIAFGMNRGDLKKQLIWYYVIAFSEITVFLIPICAGMASLSSIIWQLGVLVPPLFIILYNGQIGKGGRIFKYFFYWFYPIHLLVIGVLKWYVFR